MSGVHRLAEVSPMARLGRDVRVGPFSIVHEGVTLGDRSVIGSHCVLGHPAPGGESLVIGPNALIRSHSVFYLGSIFGDGLRTGHGVVVRERTTAGPDLQIGTASDIQGNATFGRHVRLHSGVFVAQGAAIEDFAWLFPGVRLLDDPHPPSDIGRAGVTVEPYAAIGASATVLAGLRLGAGSLVAAGSVVTRDVEPDTLVAGVPAESKGTTAAIPLRDGSGSPAYPWMRHFHRGYPADVVKAWLEEYGGPPS